MVVSVLYFILVVYGFNSLFPLRVLCKALVSQRTYEGFLFICVYKISVDLIELIKPLNFGLIVNRVLVFFY